MEMLFVVSFMFVPFVMLYVMLFFTVSIWLSTFCIAAPAGQVWIKACASQRKRESFL